MKILRVVGLGLLIIILQLLVPRIFHAMEDASIAFFHATQTALDTSQASVLRGLAIPTVGR